MAVRLTDKLQLLHRKNILFCSFASPSFLMFFQGQHVDTKTEKRKQQISKETKKEKTTLLSVSPELPNLNVVQFNLQLQ